MKVAVFSAKSYDKEYLINCNKTHEHELVFFDAYLNELTVNLSKGFDAVCVFVNDKLDAKTIKDLKKNHVQIIALRCAGYNNVDIEAAKKEGIAVVRVPEYSPEAVAEHALALILALNRKTHKAYNRVREGNFSLSRLIGFNLNGKTVGVIGTGNIGKSFARIMTGLGCNVIAYDIKKSDDLIKTGVTYVAIDTLVSESDIISLHCPLLESTHHLINAENIAQMKDGVMVINTSRGGLVNTKDMIKGLKNRKIGYFGLDVYEQEEGLFYKDLSENIIDDDQILRLIGFPNVLITSHQAFLTKEALEQISLTTLDSITAFEQGKPLKLALT